MRICRVPAVIIAVVIGGAGLAGCAASGSNPSTVPSVSVTSGSATTTAPGAAPTSAYTGTPTSAASPTHTHSAANPPVTATASHPTSSSTATTSPTSTGSGNFTVPAIPGNNVVTAWGSYKKIGTTRVQVTICAKQTGTAFSVGAIALLYSSSGASRNLGATILPEADKSACVNSTFFFYTAHLKVHAFIGGSNGTIVTTGPVLTVY